MKMPVWIKWYVGAMATPIYFNRMNMYTRVARYVVFGEDWVSIMDRSGQVWEHVPEQRVAASTFRRYSRGLRLAIPQADARSIPISLRCWLTCCNHEARGWPIGLLHSRDSLAERIWCAGSASGKRATCPYSRNWRSRTMQVTNLIRVFLSNRSLDTKSDQR